MYAFVWVFMEAVYGISDCFLSHILSFFSKVPRQHRQSDIKLTLEKTCTAQRITAVNGGNRQQQSPPPFKDRKKGLNRHCPISFIFLKHLHKSISEQYVGQKMLQTPMLSISSLTQNVKNENSHKRTLFKWDFQLKFALNPVSGCRQVTQLDILEDKGGEQ